MKRHSGVDVKKVRAGCPINTKHMHPFSFAVLASGHDSRMKERADTARFSCELTFAGSLLSPSSSLGAAEETKTR